MKTWIKIILGCIAFFLVVILIGYLLTLAVEKQEQAKYEAKEGCDAYFTIENWAFATIDCFEPRFQNRLEKLNLTGTFCFMNTYGSVRLKCDWRAD